jgi:hypothetical protein
VPSPKAQISIVCSSEWKRFCGSWRPPTANWPLKNRYDALCIVYLCWKEPLLSIRDWSVGCEILQLVFVACRSPLR